MAEVFSRVWIKPKQFDLVLNRERFEHEFSPRLHGEPYLLYRWFWLQQQQITQPVIIHQTSSTVFELHPGINRFIAARLLPKPRSVFALIRHKEKYSNPFKPYDLRWRPPSQDPYPDWQHRARELWQSLDLYCCLQVKDHEYHFGDTACGSHSSLRADDLTTGIQAVLKQAREAQQARSVQR